MRGLNLGFLGEIQILFRREERTGVPGVVIIGDSMKRQRKGRSLKSMPVPEVVTISHPEGYCCQERLLIKKVYCPKKLPLPVKVNS